MFEGEILGVKGYFKVNGGWNILSFIATNEVNFSLQKKNNNKKLEKKK